MALRLGKLCGNGAHLWPNIDCPGGQVTSSVPLSSRTSLVGIAAQESEAQFRDSLAERWVNDGQRGSTMFSVYRKIRIQSQNDMLIIDFRHAHDTCIGQ